MTTVVSAVPEPIACANCYCPRVERFCPVCGQERVNPLLPVRELVSDAAGEWLKWDSKLFVTLRLLLTQPGRLTAEYLAGRRVPYISPLRLYLWISAFYFIAFAVSAQKQLQQRFVMLPQTMHARSSAPVPPKPLTSPQPRLASSIAKKVALGGTWFASNLATVMICIMPSYALLLQLLYWRAHRLFMQHLIFVIHLQSFTLLLSLPIVFADFMRWNLILGITVLPIYTYFALRRVYGQSQGKTLLKSLLFTGGQYLMSGFVGGIIIIVVAIMSK